MELDTLTLAQLVQHKSASHLPLLTFVATEDGCEVISQRSYGTLWSHGLRIAQWMRAQGVLPGQHFAIMLQNHAEFVDCMVASSILGASFVPIVPRTMGDKLDYMLRHTHCRGIVTASYCLSEVLAQLNDDIAWVLVIDECTPQDRVTLLSSIGPICKATVELAPQNLSAPMQLMFTSGTTGDPKAVVSDYARYAAQGKRMREVFGVTPEDRLYTGLSLTHGNALTISLGGSLYAGIPLVMSQRFTSSRLWETINRYQCTVMNLLGGMFTHMYSLPETEQERNNSLRLVISAGMPKELWEPFSERYGVDIFEFYGASEGGSCINPPGTGPIGSAGRGAPGVEVLILDEEDRPCPPMVPGEIVLRKTDGSPFSVNYFENARASDDKTRGGLLRMGDIGYLDANGWLYFLHRKGGGVRVNGEFIATGFVERELAKHPSVLDAYVYGAPSRQHAGEKQLVAAIVPVDAGSFDAKALTRDLAHALEKSHIPQYFQVVQVIPKTASEKPLERKLLEDFELRPEQVIQLTS